MASINVEVLISLNSDHLVGSDSASPVVVCVGGGSGNFRISRCKTIAKPVVTNAHIVIKAEPGTSDPGNGCAGNVHRVAVLICNGH